MNSARFPIAISILILIISCGDGSRSADIHQNGNVSIYAGKGIYIGMTSTFEEMKDSLVFINDIPQEFIVTSDNCVSIITAMLVPGIGSTTADRLEYLSEFDVQNLDTSYVSIPGEISGFSIVTYVRADSTIVERVWSRGAQELAVLQVKSGNTSLNILLTSVKGILNTAEVIEPEDSLLRSVYLSDRDRSDIVEEVNADVDVPPEITHRIILNINPLMREMSVLDSLTIDFQSTQADSQLMMCIPDCDNGTSFEGITGSIENLGDSVLCTADSSRIFSGLYSGNWKGFISSSTGSITADGLRLNPAISFQSGMWFYPGSSIPSAYTFEISVPGHKGYNVYAPLVEVSRDISDSLLTISYVSPIGGIKGPLSWAAGGFIEHFIAGGRSSYICLESDTTALNLIDTAEDIAGVMWDNMGYEGARLDIVVVNSLDLPVFITGPGCIFLSTDMLASVMGVETWSDSLLSGKTVPATSLIFETARAYLASSTYLSENLRNVFAAWSVYNFILTGNEHISPDLLEAFRKYYLYSTEITGGIEYSIADPRLSESSLHDPVILGKAPAVVEFLIHEIPAFERAIPRALGTLRHSGDSFGRLFSATGISENSGYGEMFFHWFYNPGLPQIEISWMDSSGTLKLWIDQFQPGQDFPLGSLIATVLVFTVADQHDLVISHGSTEGYYSCDISGITSRILAVDIDPDCILPADIIYRHIDNEPSDI